LMVREESLPTLASSYITMLASNRLVVPWDIPESEAENYHPRTDLPGQVYYGAIDNRLPPAGKSIEEFESLTVIGSMLAIVKMKFIDIP
jgi:hypothetical protein